LTPTKAVGAKASTKLPPNPKTAGAARSGPWTKIDDPAAAAVEGGDEADEDMLLQEEEEEGELIPEVPDEEEAEVQPLAMILAVGKQFVASTDLMTHKLCYRKTVNGVTRGPVFTGVTFFLQNKKKVIKAQKQMSSKHLSPFPQWNDGSSKPIIRLSHQRDNTPKDLLDLVMNYAAADAAVAFNKWVLKERDPLRWNINTTFTEEQIHSALKDGKLPELQHPLLDDQPDQDRLAKVPRIQERWVTIAEFNIAIKKAGGGEKHMLLGGVDPAR